jgi:hypothetical protein
VGHTYFKSYLDLDAKKDKIFAGQGYNATSWGFSTKNMSKQNAEEAIKNKKIAKLLMLPDVLFFLMT